MRLGVINYYCIAIVMHLLCCPQGSGCCFGVIVYGFMLFMMYSVWVSCFLSIPVYQYHGFIFASLAGAWACMMAWWPSHGSIYPWPCAPWHDGTGTGMAIPVPDTIPLAIPSACSSPTGACLLRFNILQYRYWIAVFGMACTWIGIGTDTAVAAL